MLILERPYITITSNEQENCVYTEWHGFANSKQYREALNTYATITRDYKVTKWIGNTKNAKAIRPVDQEWTLKSGYTILQNIMSKEWQ